jgi:L-asparagine oxygenase
MSTKGTGSDCHLRHAALNLAATAGELAAAGATADTVLTRRSPAVPRDLLGALAAALPRPDPVSGWAVARGLLAGFLPAEPTPAHWKTARTERGRALDIALLLVGAALGQVFGWTGQQDGRLVHNILPSRGCEDLQVGASSLTALAWHSEDAFHPARADLLLLACVRNEDQVGCQLASVRRAGLGPAEQEHLGRPAAVVVPDDSYPGDWRSDGAAGTATVWQAEDGPCLRYDPSYTRFLDGDPQLGAAYDLLGKRLEECSETVPVTAGDVLIIDNDVAVHGRAAFTPRYDGTDRWLKRVLVQGRDARRRPPDPLETGFDQAMVVPRTDPEAQ